MGVSWEMKGSESKNRMGMDSLRNTFLATNHKCRHLKVARRDGNL